MPFAKSRNFQIRGVRQYLSGKFYLELWQSNEFLRAVIFMTNPHPPFIFWFSKKIFWYVCEGECEGAIIYYLDKNGLCYNIAAFQLLCLLLAENTNRHTNDVIMTSYDKRTVNL